MKKLIYFRLKNNFTQREVERRLKIPHIEYSRIENGKEPLPNPITMEKLGSLFQVTIQELLQDMTLEEDKYVREKKKDILSISGQQGGLTTAQMYGRKYMQEIGKRGSDLAATGRTGGAKKGGNTARSA